MTALMLNLYRSALSDKELSIAIFPFNGYFEQQLCLALPQHKFYFICAEGLPHWNTKIWTIPENATVIDSANIPIFINFDLVISPGLIERYQNARDLCDYLHIPLLLIDHISPPGNIRPEDIEGIKVKHYADMHIIAYSAIGKSWNLAKQIISYPQPLINRVNNINKSGIVIYGKFFQNSQKVLFQLQQMLGPSLQIYGNNPGLSSDVISTEALIKLFTMSKIYINLTSQAMMPPELLYAIECGCLIISVHNPVMDDLFTDNINIKFIANDKELKQILSELMSHPETHAKLISEARKVISREPFNKFRDQWQILIKEVSKMPYIRRVV